MKRYENKVALISGGAGAMGLAIARRLACEGAQVVLGDLASADAGKLDECFAGWPAPLALTLDVTQAASWQAAFEQTQQRFGRVDLLVNNAGVLSDTPRAFEDVEIAEWRHVFAVNVDGVFLGTQAALRAMRRAAAGGAIVNLGSVASFVGSKDSAAYGSSKATVRNMTKQAALSAARMGYDVRVNAVHPGFVWTPLVERRLVHQFGSREAAIAAASAMNPRGRLVQADDVAAAVAFLGSDDARMITGADLIIDGGRLIQ
ncbi:MAG: SDR family oxidoreductase [Burkholderiales bacterium]|nr:SDR family oxidoreductase [Burkholderiales bacterium]